MKRPGIGLVLLYAAGIWIGSLVHWPVTTLWWCTATLLAASLVLLRTRCALLLLFAAVLAAGVVAERATTLVPGEDVTRLLERRDQNAGLRGVIVSDPGYRATADGGVDETTSDRHSFRLNLSAVARAGTWQRAAGRILVFVSPLRDLRELRYGDAIECTAIVRVPPGARNPGTFDWRAWLAQHGMAFTATIRQDDGCTVLTRDRGDRLTALSLRLRARFERALRCGLEDEPELAGVLAGMVIGAREEIPAETHADFQITGVFHVFAINGLHVGLVTVIVLVALRLVRIPRRWCGLVAVPLLVLYVFATGAHPGAVRALVMAGVWLWGGVFLRPADGLNNLAVAAGVLLAWNPMELFDGGFVLSFAVVTAIVVLAPRIELRLKKMVAADPFLPAPLVGRWRTVAAAPLAFFLKLLSCSIAAWLGLVPLLALYFHLFTPISIVANLVVIPLLSGVIALGLLATLAHAAWPALAAVFNNANFFVLSGLVRAVNWLGGVPGGHAFVCAPPVWLIVGYYAVGIALLNAGRWWPRYRGAAISAGVTITLFALVKFWPENAVEITVLDLDDGASCFVNGPGARADFLIDGGGEWSGRRVVVPFLRAQGVDRLGAVVVTRGDKAHVAGLPAVVNQIPVRTVVQSGLPTRSKYYDQWLRIVAQRRLPVRQLTAGTVWRLGELNVCILNPPARGLSDRSDDNALVLVLEFGPTRMLLMSDAGTTVERQLLGNGAELHAQIVVKGRHGAERSGTVEFLAAVQPEMVVQMVNAQSHRRYAEPGLAERLAQRGVQTLRTDETGAVIVRLTKRGYTIRTCLGPER